MTNFIVKNLINGKLTFEQVQKSKVYSPYVDAVIAELDARGYMIDENGNCVKKDGE